MGHAPGCRRAPRSHARLSAAGSVHCSEHRPVQRLEPDKVREGPCGICLTATGRLEGANVLCTPCCGHTFHRLCLQVTGDFRGLVFGR